MVKPFFFSEKKNPLGKKKTLENNIITKGMRLHGGTKFHLYRQNRRFRHVEGENRRFSSSKGQYRIVSEILLFAIGLAVASFVIVVFGNLQDTVSLISAQDQMMSVSNAITASVIKSMDYNTTIRLRIPDTISGEPYVISFESVPGSPCTPGNCVLRLRTVTSGITTTQQLFNISQSHIITGNVYSTARYIEIISNSSSARITVDRA